MSEAPKIVASSVNDDGTGFVVSMRDNVATLRRWSRGLPTDDVLAVELRDLSDLGELLLRVNEADDA